MPLVAQHFFKKQVVFNNNNITRIYSNAEMNQFSRWCGGVRVWRVFSPVHFMNVACVCVGVGIVLISSVRQCMSVCVREGVRGVRESRCEGERARAQVTIA